MYYSPTEAALWVFAYDVLATGIHFVEWCTFCFVSLSFSISFLGTFFFKGREVCECNVLKKLPRTWISRTSLMLMIRELGLKDAKQRD